MIESVNMYGRICKCISQIIHVDIDYWARQTVPSRSVGCLARGGGSVTCQCRNLNKHYLSQVFKVTVAGIIDLVGKGHFSFVIFLPQTQSSSLNMRNCSQGTFCKALLRAAKVITNRRSWDLMARKSGGHMTPMQCGLWNKSLEQSVDIK